MELMTSRRLKESDDWWQIIIRFWPNNCVLTALLKKITRDRDAVAAILASKASIVVIF